ncbi:hypothetical protein [Indioceanicola profundi]|nr:hypothetical protein [Indioceanicola profundi]
MPFELDDFKYVLKSMKERVLTAELAAIGNDPQIAATVFQLAIDMGLT